LAGAAIVGAAIGGLVGNQTADSSTTPTTLNGNPAIVVNSDTLTWTPVAGADHYEIWRYSTQWEFLTSAPASTLAFTVQQAAHQARLRIVAVNQTGARSQVAEAILTGP
jgi:hypothetical protein